MSDSLKPFFPFFKNEANVLALATTRHYGKSVAPFASLNVGINVGDDDSLVKANRKILASYLKTDTSKMFFMEQIHSNNITILTEKNLPLDNTAQKTDALITNMKNTAICALSADCPLIGLYDKENNVIAVIHAGWKGLTAKIIEKTVDKMQQNFDSQPKNIRSVISAFICKKCFCIKDDTVKYFQEAYPNNKNIITKDNQGIYRADLKKAVLTSLTNKGLLKSNICFLDKCTVCENELFFSYRAENQKTGRCALAFKLNPS